MGFSLTQFIRELATPRLSEVCFSPDNGRSFIASACLFCADFVAKVGCCRCAVGNFVKSGRL
jgi:hypothetical protein